MLDRVDDGFTFFDGGGTDDINDIPGMGFNQWFAGKVHATDDDTCTGIGRFEGDMRPMTRVKGYTGIANGLLDGMLEVAQEGSL